MHPGADARIFQSKLSLEKRTDMGCRLAEISGRASKKGETAQSMKSFSIMALKLKIKKVMSLSKKYALQRLRELQYKRNRNQPFESEDGILLDMQQLMEFLKQDPSVRNYLKKTLYEL